MRENNLESFDNDIYNRKNIAKSLTMIIESNDEAMVISLDSQWGTGKTTFIKMWKDLLEKDEIYNSKFDTLYFNAWENDYIKDPLLALFSEIENQINKKDGSLNQSFQKVKNVILPMAKLVARVGIKIGTAGVLDIDKIDIGDKTEDTILDLASKLGDLSIKEISASKSIREKFKEVMGEYQKEINKKIIFFIDELDRCRPTFAIELLEAIKHLFNIDNCIFIISIDKEQLGHSVSTVYGQNMDTIGYLRRFFDLDYKLPKIDRKKYIDNKNSIIFENNYNVELFKVFLKELFIIEDLSLRDIDKAYYYISLLKTLIKEFNYEEKWNSVYLATISYIYATLITIKIKKPILYKKIIDGEYETKDVMREIKLPDMLKYSENIDGWHMKPLTEVISQIMQPYLDLNLKFIKSENLNLIDSDEYLVGLKNEDGSFKYNYKFSLLYLFKDTELFINNKLEFIEGFQL